MAAAGAKAAGGASTHAGSSSGGSDEMVAGAGGEPAAGGVDGVGGAGPEVVCEPAEKRCSDAGVPQICAADGTAFVDQAACAAETPTCDVVSGECIGECQVGTKRCNTVDQSVQECDLQGLWKSTMQCAFACLGDAETTDCGGKCRPGTGSCGAENTPSLCDKTGTPQPQAQCAFVCVDDGKCGGDCKPTATRCAAGSTTKAETCLATGIWGAATSCTFVCDATKQACGGECTPGAPDQCSGSKVQSCGTDGLWNDKANCGAVPCSKGVCAACVPKQKQCNAGKPQTCSAAGAWADDQATACQFLCEASTGKCTGECIPGSDACFSSTSKHCGAAATYDGGIACTNICDTATGKCGGECKPTTHHCSGDVAQTCQASGKWKDDPSCQYGCVAATGLCNTCTDEAMATTCGSGKCGPTLNNCARTVQCSTSCSGVGQSCGGGAISGVCGCSPQTSAQTCQNGALCGSVKNNCGQTVTCSVCTLPQTCGGNATPNVCGCSKEPDDAFCSRLGKSCGAVSGTDNCGIARSVPDCGSCDATSQICKSNKCACTAGYTGVNCSQPRFEVIGSTIDYGYGVGVSGDGSVIAGTSYDVNEVYSGFVWTQAAGAQKLTAVVPANEASLEPYGISKDGKVIVGFFDVSPTRAFRWTAAGKAVALGTLPGGSHSYAYAVSADGSVVGGISDKTQAFVYFPYRWTSAGGMAEIPLGEGTAGSVSGVSDDGNTVIGTITISGTDTPYHWTVGESAATSIGLTFGSGSSHGRGVSGNGLVIVGDTDFNRAFRWSSGTGFIGIADSLSAGSSGANAANIDGTVVVGSSSVGAWVWDSTNGARLIKDIVAGLGFSTTNYDLRTLNAVSSDGKTVVGGTSTPSGIDRSYVVRLP
jgi:probable HAF family extracellular repeat protein